MRDRVLLAAAVLAAAALGILVAYLAEHLP